MEIAGNLRKAEGHAKYFDTDKLKEAEQGYNATGEDECMEMLNKLLNNSWKRFVDWRYVVEIE